MIQFKKKPFRLLYLLLIFLSTGITRGGETSIWPVDTKPAHTSSFGEFRPGHFHSGIDLKLYGRVGDPCRAVEDGWVSRIKVTSTGYGRALYLTMVDGRTAVYAHLDSFAPVIEELVQREQHIQQSYSIELFFTPDSAVRFKRGDLVAYAGRSAAKHPHVHFEIRDSAEKPMNPWFQGFNVADDISPVPRALAIEPLDGNSTVEEDYQPRIWSDLVRRNNGLWGPRDPIDVSGRIGISVKAWDKAHAAENLLGVYQLEM